MGAIGEMTLEDAAREAAGNWRRWTCFVWDRKHEIDDPESWAIIYSHNRDSGLLDQSNADVIAKAITQPTRRTMNRADNQNSHVPATTTNENGHTASENPGTSLAALIQDAEALHTTLSNAKASVPRLISGLRRYRKQSRLLSDTLKSLRQLKLTEHAE